MQLILWMLLPLTLGVVSKMLPLPKQSTPFLLFVIVKIAFPALIFEKISRMHLTNEIFFFLFIAWGVFLLSVILAYLVALQLKLQHKEKVAFIIISTLSNTAFLGIPFINLYYPDIITYAIVYDQLVSFIALSLFAPLLIASTQNNNETKFSLLPLVKKPAFFTFIVALSFSNFTLPDLLYQISEPLGALVVPLSLFVIGRSFNFHDITSDPKVLVSVLFLTLFLSPFITTLLFFSMGFTTAMYHLLILDMAMPPMVMASILLVDAKLNEPLALSSVSVGLILSFITIPLWESFLKFLL